MTSWKNFFGLTKGIGQHKKITCYCVKERSLYFACAVNLRVIEYRILKYSKLILDTFLEICIYSRYFEILGYSILFRYSVFKSILFRVEYLYSILFDTFGTNRKFQSVGSKYKYKKSIGNKYRILLEYSILS